MNGIVIYSKNKNRAEDICECFFNDEHIESRIIHIKNISSVDWGNEKLLIIEWQCRINVIFSAWDYLDHFRVILFNNEFISDIDNTETVDRLEKKAYAAKNWELCKDFNEFRIIAALIRKKTYLNSYPMKLQMETTDICNARCIMCSHAYSKGSGANVLTSGVVDRLKGILPYLRVLILHGNGEPFLTPDITNYLKDIASYGVKFITNTNLSVICDDLLPIIKNNFIELNVSCDGHTKDLYEKIRVGLDFDNFIKNVKQVRSECPKLRMRMAVVIMRQNLEYLKEFVAFADELGFNEIVFNHLYTNENNHNLFDSAFLYPEQMNLNIEKAVQEGSKRKISVVVPDYKDDRESSETKKSICGICDWLIECPYIDTCGNVGVCCINQNEKMGNVFDTAFSEIWNSEHYMSFRKAFYLGAIPDICRGCDFLTQHRLAYMNTENISSKYQIKNGI